MNLRPLSPLLLAASLCSVSLAQDLPYEKLANRFLEEHGQADAAPDTFELELFLQDRFLHTEAGLFDLYLSPSAARRESDIEDYQRVVMAVLEAQQGWLDWLDPSGKQLRDVRKDHAALVKWVKRWKIADLARHLKESGGSTLEILDAKDSVAEASGRLAEFLTAGGALMAREDGKREPLVLVPDRETFTQFLCLGGWKYATHRSTYWQPDIVNWTNFYIDDVKVLAMQFASPNRSPGDYSSGLRMDFKTSTGLEQQIVQLAANSMFANYYGERVPPSLAGALAINLVIDQFGECNTRVDGDLRARRSSAVEIFVPGGNPGGGILPPNMADSRWRDNQGSDYFVAELRRALPKKKGRKPLGTFELMDERERNYAEVSGPFLGMAAAVADPLPSTYLGDQMEFLRAYRSCFMHWLQAKGAGSSKKACAASFAELLRGLAATPDATELEQVFKNVYEKPLSTSEMEKKELEARFLSWLAKGR